MMQAKRRSVRVRSAAHIPSYVSASVGAGILLLLLVSERAALAQQLTGSTTTESTGGAPLNRTRREIRLGLINGGSEFFEPIKLGFEQKCKELGVTCFYRVSNQTNTTCIWPRLDYVREFLYDLDVDGIAMKPCLEEDDPDNIGLHEEAEAAGVPIVTFDSQLENLTHAAYVGTDQVFMGQTMARLLRQLRPEGGTYAIIGRKRDRVDAFVEEISRYNDRPDKASWHNVEENITAYLGLDDFFERMQDLALLNPTAMLTFYQTPMRHENWTDFVDAHRHRNITLIGVDGSDFQIDYLNRRYVDGLIGQLPYEFGTESAQVLYDLITKGNESDVIKNNKTFFPTNVVAYNLIPVDLPPLEMDQNLLGNLVYIGYTCFGVVIVSALVCIAWTLYHGKKQSMVVKAAQPFFLLMVASGIILLSSAIVPLSFDDGASPETKSATFRVGICMSIPWLAFIGFTVTFSALFSKTWRVNKLFRSSAPHARFRVTERDVLMPFAVLLGSNIIVLASWTAIDPLTYVRDEYEGTDYWNRPLASYGVCRSDNAAAYLVPLALINLGVVAIACWQAVQARNITSEFSESLYIGLSVFSLFQAFLTGIPVTVVVKDMPEAFYVVLTIMVFLLCMAILLLIFLPKMFMEREYSRMSLSERNRAFAESLRRSSGCKGGVRGGQDGDYSWSLRPSGAFGGGSGPLELPAHPESALSVPSNNDNDSTSDTPVDVIGEGKETE